MSIESAWKSTPAWIRFWILTPSLIALVAVLIVWCMFFIAAGLALLMAFSEVWDAWVTYKKERA